MLVMLCNGFSHRDFIQTISNSWSYLSIISAFLIMLLFVQKREENMVANFVMSLMQCLLFMVPMMANLSTCRVSGAPVQAEVTHFPDFDGPLPSKHYAG